MSGSAQMKASLELTLQDGLSSGLNKLKDLLGELRELANSLGFGKLEASASELRNVAGDLDPLKSQLAGVRTEATEAADAIEGIRAATAEAARTPIAPLVAGRDEKFEENVRGGGGGGGGAHGGGSSGEAADGFFAGAALYEPSAAYAEFQKTLTQIAITEGLKAPAAVQAEVSRLTALFDADALKSGQTSTSIAEAYLDLLGQGIPKDLLDRAIGFHSEAATAYGVSAETLGAPVGAMLGQLGIDDKTLPGALAAMAVASKSGRFKVADFATELANASGQAGLIGMTGRAGVDEIFAILETVMRNVGQPSSAAADVNNLIGYIFAPREDKRAAKMLGVDLPKYLADAKKHGINALDAYLGLLRSRTRGMDGQTLESFLAPLIANSEARTAVIALLEHGQFRKDLQARLDRVDGSTLAQDVATAGATPQVQLDKSKETVTQLNRGVGQDFTPILVGAGQALAPFNTALAWMNANFPRTTALLLGGAGALLAVVAALAALKFGFGLLSGGWELLATGVTWAARLAAGFVLANPLVLVLAATIALVGLAVYGIYDNWDKIGPWFHSLIAGLKQDWLDFSHWFDTSLLGEALGLDATPQVIAARAHAGGAKALGSTQAQVSGQININVNGGIATVSAQSHNPAVDMRVNRGNTTRRP